MKPISLKFQAFGAYVNEQYIDFTKLCEAGIFLIQGETGAGKTIILDAITYALYGKSSGGERGEITTMRSQIAPIDVKTFVEYIFSIKGQKYKLLRGLKPIKKRIGGTDFASEQNMFIMNVDGIFEPVFINPKLKDIECSVSKIIGLNYEQFCKVVILPQGRFERLLIAHSEEKEEILISLFGADKWQRVSENLAIVVSDERRRLDVIKEGHLQILREYRSENIDDLIELYSSKSQHLTLIKTEQFRLQQEITLLKGKFELAVEVWNKFSQKEKTEKELHVLESKSVQMESMAVRLERSVKAEEVGFVYNIFKQSERNFENRLTAVNTQKSNLVRCEELLRFTQKNTLELERKQLEIYEEHNRTLRRYMNNISGRLARALNENKACPVCGSLSHPNPAILLNSEDNMVNFNDILEQNRSKIAASESLIKLEKGKLEQQRTNYDTSLATLSSMEAELTLAEDTARSAKVDFLDRLLLCGFKDISDLLQNTLTANQRTNISKELENFFISKQVLEKSLAELSEQLKGKECPDIANLRFELSERDKSFISMTKEIAIEDSFLTRLDNVVKRLKSELVAYEIADRRCCENQVFYKHIRGDNGIGFSRYVLGVMLSSITNEANRLLMNVHNGRYRLYRTMETTGRTRKSGLELEVYDSFSAERRLVNSLSGGEKFLVSLTLAIGLSTVVQSQSGGVKIDGMFIDEGFGTLDSTSISDAMAILSSMRKNNGFIGIISHLTELKESISAKIEVAKSSDGSSLQVVCG